jgi:methionyl-tRNA formyltransferase
LAAEGAMLLVETLRGIAAGTIRPVAQEHGRASSAPMLTREHGLWNPAWTARALEGRVRGFDPWPGVWASRSGSRLRIAEARALPGETTDAESGKLLTLDGEGLQLACAAGSVAAIASVQLAGGRAMTAAEAVNGRLVRPGDRLERPEPAA